MLAAAEIAEKVRDEACKAALLDERGDGLGVGGELGSQSADILVISNEPRSVARIMRLARQSTRTLNLGLVLVTLFDVLALGAAGFLALPLVSVSAVLVSSVLAGASIWRLRK